MIAVSKGVTFGGDTVYTSLVQVDVYDDIPVLRPSLCVGGASFDDVARAIEHAELGCKALAGKIPSFAPIRSRVAVLRSRLPGRVEYRGYMRIGKHKGVPILQGVGTWSESIDDVIAATRVSHG
jgi:hypothetical protein